MELAGVGLAAGRSDGVARCVDRLPSDVPSGSDPVVWVTPGPDWPGPGLAPPTTAAVIVETSPNAPGPASVPVVGGLPANVFRDADRLVVDGDRGVVRLSSVREVRVVTAFVERDDGRILLLRRSGQVGSFQGRWAGVSGFLEDPTAEGQALREILEETSLPPAALTVLGTAPPIYARDGGTVYAAQPFRIRTRDAAVRLNWENDAFDWVDPAEIARRPTVPNLDRAWRAVAPAVRPKR